MFAEIDKKYYQLCNEYGRSYRFNIPLKGLTEDDGEIGDCVVQALPNVIKCPIKIVRRWKNDKGVVSVGSNQHDMFEVKNLRN